MYATKSACENLNYRRNQKYFRTLNAVVKNFRTRKTKTTTFQNFSFCFFKLAEAVYLNFLYHVTPSSAAVFKLWFYGTLLRSKTIKPRLKNCPVQARSAGTVLQRLVMQLLLAKKLWSSVPNTTNKSNFTFNDFQD